MPQRILFILFQALILSVVDCGLGLLTLSKAQLDSLETIQNQGMRIVLGCTRDTSCEAMLHYLGLDKEHVRKAQECQGESLPKNKQWQETPAAQ